MKRYEIIKEYSKEKIEEFYSGYMENIAQGVFPSFYIHPESIKRKENGIRTWTLIAQKDKYIEKYRNCKTGLAEDILKNGNYFPIWCYREGGDWWVSEGVHRLESIKKAAELGIWTNQTVFCLELDKKFDVAERKLEPTLLESRIEVNMPVYCIENGWYEKHFGKHFYRFDNWKRFKAMKEDGNCKIIISTEDELFNISKIYHKLLRHAFFKYQNANEDRIEARFPIEGGKI